MILVQKKRHRDESGKKKQNRKTQILGLPYFGTETAPACWRHPRIPSLPSRLQAKPAVRFVSQTSTALHLRNVMCMILIHETHQRRHSFLRRRGGPRTNKEKLDTKPRIHAQDMRAQKTKDGGGIWRAWANHTLHLSLLNHYCCCCRRHLFEFETPSSTQPTRTPRLTPKYEVNTEAGPVGITYGRGEPKTKKTSIENQV